MDYNLIAYPLLLAAINFVLGYMIANAFAYAKYKLHYVMNTELIFKKLGGLVTLGVSLICSFFIDPSLQHILTHTESITLTRIGIIATVITLTSSSSLLGFILTFRCVSNNSTRINTN